MTAKYYSPASHKATMKYRETLDLIQIHVKKGKRDAIKEHAASTGESVNAFIVRAIDEAIERDGLARKE